METGPMLRTLITLCAVVLLSTLVATSADARTGSSGSGRLAQGSIAASNRSTKQAPVARSNASRPATGNRNPQRPDNGGDRVNAGNNVNVGNDVNIGNDVDIDVDVDHDYGHGWDDHPVAAGVVIGTVAVTRAAVLGSYYRALPAGCTVVYRNGIAYYYCGSVYYSQTWYGNDVVYVVVNP